MIPWPSWGGELADGPGKIPSILGAHDGGDRTPTGLASSPMSAILLSVHVILAVLAVGPIAVAASVFPRYAGTPGAGQVLHRICVTYAAVGVAVPLLGIATAVAMAALTQV
jgi:hypothetical protein